MWLTLVGVAFVIVDESAVDKARASGSGVITGEIPVARMTGNSLMQPFDRLVDNVDIGIYGAVGCEHLNHLMRNLVLSEGGIHSFHAIDKLRVRLRLLLNAVTVSSRICSMPRSLSSCTAARNAMNSPIRDMSMP